MSQSRIRARRGKWSDAQLTGAANRHGGQGPSVISPGSVVTAQWVRWKCRFGCGGYGTSRMCPPHTPTPDQTRRLLDEYDRAVLFEAPRGQAKAIAAELERDLFLAGHYRALGLGAGPCTLCEQCLFDEGCLHPRRARPSMEACGIDVYATVRAHGREINVVRAEADPQHYFGLVLVD